MLFLVVPRRIACLLVATTFLLWKILCRDRTARIHVISRGPHLQLCFVEGTTFAGIMSVCLGLPRQHHLVLNRQATRKCYSCCSHLSRSQFVESAFPACVALTASLATDSLLTLRH